MDFRTFSEKVAVKAGSILIDKKKDFIVKKVKDNQMLDIATTADYASEEYIISQIKKHYPDHSILAEETGFDTSLSSQYQWIIDPLDGTKEYSRGIPYYYILIALEYNNELISAVAYQPELKRMFSVDEKSYLNGKTISVSKTMDLSKSFVSVALPSSRMPEKVILRSLGIIKKLCKTIYRVRNTQWDVDSLNHVALGAYDGYITVTSSEDVSHAKWWDVAPGILMVKKAGGKVTDLDNNEVSDKSLPNGIVASNGLIHDKLLSIVRDSK